MSLRTRVVLPVTLFALAALAGCGGNGSPTAVPPPTGGFSDNNLNGTYVFSVSGTDVNGAPYAIVGTFTASGGSGNGTQAITGGTIDINDAALTNPVPNSSVGNNSVYFVGVDGRGEIQLNTSTPFGTIALDFVLQNSSHGLVTELDNTASGSGTIDIQTAGVTPSGPYAFSFAGADPNGGPMATAGNFTVGQGGTIGSGGTEDFNDNGSVVNVDGETITGTVVAGPSNTPATVLITGASTRTYDVYAIDASHLKFIEMTPGSFEILSGDAFSETSTTLPTGTLAFTLAGALAGEVPTAAGGFLVTDGNGSNGNITDASTEDSNVGGTQISTTPITITASYSGTPNGRFTLTNFSGNFVGGTEFVAYPFSSGGVFLLQIGGGGVMSGSASLQTAGATLGASQGYGLNFTGINVSGALTGSSEEVDDLAEFQTTSTPCGTATGSIVSGLIDENFDPGGSPTPSQVLCGNYSTPDSNGRGQIATVTTNNTLNGGFGLTYYTVDGTTFPFIETDNGGQVSAGVFVEQNAGTVSITAAKSSSMFLVRPIVKPHSFERK